MTLFHGKTSQQLAAGLIGDIFYLKFEPENFKPIFTRRQIMYIQL
jgi:hypothetical protein